MRVEPFCTVGDYYACERSWFRIKEKKGLPIIKKMTDNQDGSYTADYSVSVKNTLSVSVELLEKGSVR